MDLLSFGIILVLVLLTGCLLGFWLFVPWLRSRKINGTLPLWIRIWALGWILQAIGWLLYSQTYQRMDQYPKPVDFSKNLIGLSFLLWIVAFGLYRKIKPIGIFVLSGFLAASVVIPDTLAKKQGTPPSDEELILNYQHHQTAFNQLALMAQSDKGLQSVSARLVLPDDLSAASVPAKRIDQYLNLLKIAGLQSCSTSDHRDVELCAWGIGNALSSDQNKGYAYLAKPPVNLLKSLDQSQPEDLRFGVEVYRHIEGHWYLFYEYIPG